MIQDFYRTETERHKSPKGFLCAHGDAMAKGRGVDGEDKLNCGAARPIRDRNCEASSATGVCQSGSMVGLIDRGEERKPKLFRMSAS
jgi:hypothetical protein